MYLRISLLLFLYTFYFLLQIFYFPFLPFSFRIIGFSKTLLISPPSDAPS